MQAIVVDLKTRIFPIDHQIFLTRPGKGCALYADFLSESVIGPGLLNLGLERGKPLSEYEDLVERVKRAVAIRNWINHGRIAKHKPPAALREYAGKHNRYQIAQYLAVIQGYFEKAKKGDLGLMFPASYGQDAILYEFTTEPTAIVEFKPRHYRYAGTLSTRRIKKVASVERRFLPGKVLEVIEKPNSFVQLGFSEKEFFYDLGFKSYQFSDEFSARFDVKSPEYNTHDDLIIKALINAIATNVADPIDGEKARPFKEAAFHDLGDEAPELSSSINSPGFHRLRSSHIISSAVAVVLAIAIAGGVDAVEVARNGLITIGNSQASADDPCTAQVAESVLRYFQLNGIEDDWPQQCELARQVAESTNLSTGVSVREEE